MGNLFEPVQKPPEFQVFGSADEEINDDLLEGEELRFPLFVKPSREGTGIGVTAKSIVHSVEELRERLGEMLNRYNQPLLCERYIDGRELTVGLIGNLGPTAARRLNDRTAPEVLPGELTFFPALEVDISKYGESEAGVYTNRIKTDLVDTFHYTCPARIDSGLADRLNRLAAAVFRVMGCLDISRVDFRLDNEGSPYILEINPLPGLNPDYSDLPIEAKAAGWSYERFIKSIIDIAAERWGIKAG
jgi:D-alanine-D-alanine ligase